MVDTGPGPFASARYIARRAQELLRSGGRWLTVAAAVALGACHADVPAKGKVATIATLSVSCEPHDEALNCRAIGQIADDRGEPRRETDLTDAVAWATSNGKTANIIRGRVTANEPGTATIIASVRSGDETVSSSVLVVVDGERVCPQLAYDLKGVVRDLLNTGMTNVEVTLVDDRGHARTIVTREADSPSDGAFHFIPVLGGQYRLRATKPGYRPVERLVNVPDATPLTLVLLFDPQ
jgi:hypothetical protein